MKLFGKEQVLIVIQKLAEMRMTLYFSTQNQKSFITRKLYQAYDENYIKSHYNKTDDKGRKYRTDNLTAMGLSGGGYNYEWNGVNKLWRMPKERMQELHDEKRIRYTKTGTAEFIRYLDEMPGNAVARCMG